MAPDQTNRMQGTPDMLVLTSPALAEQRLLVSFYGESENNRRAKYYKLTSAGRRQLETETKR